MERVFSFYRLSGKLLQVLSHCIFKYTLCRQGSLDRTYHKCSVVFLNVILIHIMYAAFNNMVKPEFEMSLKISCD